MKETQQNDSTNFIWSRKGSMPRQAVEKPISKPGKTLLPQLLVCTSMLLALLPIQAAAVEDTIWTAAVKDIRLLTNAFRDGITPETAKDGTALRNLDSAVGAKARELRADLERKFAKRPEGVSVLGYLPEGAALDGGQDLREHIQRALDENDCVLLPAGDDPERPFIYGVACDDQRRGLIIPAGKTLISEPGAIVRRLPSAGSVINLKAGARAIGVTVDGNKRAHAIPEILESKGTKSYMSFTVTGNDAAIIDCESYDSPGIAFGTWASRALVWRCKARNAGIIDYKYNANFYQGKWDNWSGDGFYMRGFDNVAMDNEAYDCFRWGYTTCHGKSGGALYIDNMMRNDIWTTYGFIDIEDCHDDKVGSILYGMKAPTGKKTNVSIYGSDRTVLLSSELGSLNGRNANQAIVAGCTIMGGGLAIGGWSSTANSWVRGGDNPIVVGNTILKRGVLSDVVSTSDWSLSVFSDDEKGLAVGNSLKEYEGPLGKGPGMKIEKVYQADNTVEYGVWLDDGAAGVAEEPAARTAADEFRSRKMREFGAGVPALARQLGIEGTVTRTLLLNPEASFIRDIEDVGRDQEWFDPAKRPAADQLTPILLGDSWQNQIGDYRGVGWYFTTFKVDGDDYHLCDTVNLLFGSVSAICHVYVNGQFVGDFDKWNEPFTLSIPRQNGPIKWDDTVVNDVAIRVLGPGAVSGIYEHAALVLSDSTKAAPEKTRKESFHRDFLEGQSLGGLVVSRRVSALPQGVLLRGDGALVTRDEFGPGTYHVRFRIDESDAKFAYHVPMFLLGMQDAGRADKATSILRRFDYFSILWRNNGQVTFSRATGADGDKEHKSEKLGEWAEPGPDSVGRYDTEKAVDLTVVVPEAGGELRLYLKKSRPEGEPTCTFTLPNDFKPGSFGFLNAKWFSLVYLHELNFEPS